MANRREKKWKLWQNLFSLAPKSLQMVTAAMKLKDTYTWKVMHWDKNGNSGFIKPKNWCFWTEKTLESPLDCKEIQPVHPKGNQCRMFIGRTDAEAEAPILWPRDANWLLGKDPDAGKDWRQEKKGTFEDKMVGTRWTWVWASSGRRWRIGKPGMQ